MLTMEVPKKLKKIPLRRKRAPKRNILYKEMGGGNATELVEDLFGMYILEYLSISNNKLVLEKLDVITKRMKEVYVKEVTRMCRRELRHIVDCAYVDEDDLLSLKTKKLKIEKRKIKINHHSVSLEDCLELFYKIHWRSAYGGLLWARIAYRGLCISKANNAREIVQEIDKLNQLSHNTDSCLNKFRGLKHVYTTVLDIKAHTASLEIMVFFASLEIERLYTFIAPRINNENKLNMAESWIHWHSGK